MVSWLERRAQQELCRRAMDTAAVANIGVALFLAQLSQDCCAEEQDHESVSLWASTWRRAWSEVRSICDRNLHRDRPHYDVQPFGYLSQILSLFDQHLARIEQADPVEAPKRTQYATEAGQQIICALADYHLWMASMGRLVDFDADKYLGEAARKAQRFWG
jgi:hypothetical protein